jgi:hypothetical protein
MSGYFMFELITVECCDCHKILEKIPRSTRRCGLCAGRRRELLQQRRDLKTRSARAKGATSRSETAGSY